MNSTEVYCFFRTWTICTSSNGKKKVCVVKQDWQIGLRRWIFDDGWLVSVTEAFLCAARSEMRQHAGSIIVFDGAELRLGRLNFYQTLSLPSCLVRLRGYSASCHDIIWRSLLNHSQLSGLWFIYPLSFCWWYEDLWFSWPYVGNKETRDHNVTIGPKCTY